MKPKRVYVYWIEGKGGHRIILKTKNPWKYRVNEFGEANYVSMEIKKGISTTIDTEWEPIYYRIESPIADFIPSEEGEK